LAVCAECLSKDIEISDMHDEIEELKEKAKAIESERYDLEQENKALKDAMYSISVEAKPYV